MFLKQTSQDVLIFSTGQSAFSRPSDHWCSSAVMENESILLYMCRVVHLGSILCPGSVWRAWCNWSVFAALTMTTLTDIHYQRTILHRACVYLYVHGGLYHLRKITWQCTETHFKKNIYFLSFHIDYKMLQNVKIQVISWGICMKMYLFECLSVAVLLHNYVVSSAIHVLTCIH